MSETRALETETPTEAPPMISWVISLPALICLALGFFNSESGNAPTFYAIGSALAVIAFVGALIVRRQLVTREMKALMLGHAGLQVFLFVVMVVFAVTK